MEGIKQREDEDSLSLVLLFEPVTGGPTHWVTIGVETHDRREEAAPPPRTSGSMNCSLVSSVWPARVVTTTTTITHMPLHRNAIVS